MTPPFNILCIVTDQQRADHLGCYYNGDVQTPHIDRLAAEGTVFDESYVSNPLCMPNRATLFTGLYPKVHGVRENGIGLSPTLPLLPEILRKAGYRTGSFGKLHLAPYGIERHSPPESWEVYETPEYWESHNTLPRPFYGFEEVYYVGGHGPYTFGHYKHDIGEAEHQKLSEPYALSPLTGAKESWKCSIDEAHHYNTRIADHTIDFIERQTKDDPFFIWCSFPDPHHPYMPPAPYCDQYDPDSIKFDPARRVGELQDLPPYFQAAHDGSLRLGGLQGGARISDAHYREIIAHTYGMISMVDHQVGRLIQALEAKGALENTIIIFMSDHGDLMGDHWLINKGPFPFRGLLRVPTIWRVPERLNPSRTKAFISAVDFAPTVLDFAQIAPPVPMQGRSYRQVLTGETDSIRNVVYVEYDSTYLNDRLRILRTPDWSITFYANSSEGLLYNLREDPSELYNLWNASEYDHVKQELLIQLLRVASQQDSWQPGKKSHA